MEPPQWRYWPYGVYHVLCGVVGWLIGGIGGAALGFCLGPAGLLIDVMIQGHR